MLAKLPYTIPSLENGFAQGPVDFSRTLNTSGSDDYSNIASVSVHDQDRWVDDMANGDAAYLNESYVTRGCEVRIDRRYVPTGWEEHIDGEMFHGNERLSSGNTGAMEWNWAVAGYSSNAIQSSPLSAGTLPNLAVELLNNSWTNGAPNFDEQESMDMVASGNESSDGDGGAHHEIDVQTIPFNSARLEPMVRILDFFPPIPACFSSRGEVFFFAIF